MVTIKVINMSKKFIKPKFSPGVLEFRVEGDEVSIYGNSQGLNSRINKFL